MFRFTISCSAKIGVSGGPIVTFAPILAEIYLSNFENKHFIDILLKELFYYKYIDDIIMIIPTDISETKFLNYLNSLDPHLKFTIENEMQKHLIFWTLQFVNEITKLLLVGIKSHQIL